MMAGVDIVHVPYRGAGPSLTGMLGNQVQVMFDNLPSSLPQVQSGKLRALGVTTDKRSAALPDVPTVGETVSGYEASAFFGMSTTKNAPRQAVDTLNKAVNAALADPEMQKKLADLGGTIIPRHPGGFRQARCRGNRQVGQGGEGGRPQGGIVR
jgi:tripartite-type tricarboxylate transporter receptor subunit TctC